MGMRSLVFLVIVGACVGLWLHESQEPVADTVRELAKLAVMLFPYAEGDKLRVFGG